MTDQRRSKGNAGTTVMLTGDIFMLSEELMKKNYETHHASGDADLIAQKQKAVQSALSCNIVLAGDDTDLLVLLSFHARLESHDLFFCPEPKKNTKQPRI